MFDYRLGSRSALEWVINQYQVKKDERKVNGVMRGSGIVNDPNRADDERYIVRLIGKVITVSLETVRIVERIRSNLTLGEIRKNNGMMQITGRCGFQPPRFGVSY